MNKSPLSEYPRMIMQRASYLSLNGIWQYAIKENSEIPDVFAGDIVVPYSPETTLSGVKRRVLPKDYLFYKKVFKLPENFVKTLVFLHFSAVDQLTTVYLNGIKLGDNVGGFHPFSFEISSYLKEENELVLVVKDLTDTSYHSRGKQKLKAGNIWYTPQSGIYLPVWLESVPKDYISQLKITPLFDEGGVEITVYSDSSRQACIKFEGQEYFVSPNNPIIIKPKEVMPWTPDTPHLYDFGVRLGEDEVKSYFALRKISVGEDERGVKRIYLNNKELFQTGLLDQGYYHESLLTPPTDDALISDIMLAKKMGFNVLRKHIKIEWERFYYHCDRLGMLVWQDFVNGGESYNFYTVHVPAILNIRVNDHRYSLFGRKNSDGRRDFYNECERTIKHLYNYPSIILWTVFNEGWGQFDATQLLPFVKQLDDTRLIDIHSGWHDQRIGDFKSLHVYFRPFRFRKDKLNRAVILSEFGGYSYRVSNHTFSEKDFGYRIYQSKEALTEAFVSLYENQIIPAKEKGLCAAIYTQLSDVEEEINGIVTYDRKVVKLDEEVVRKLNEKLKST